MATQPWVVLVDARRAKLLRVSMGEQGHVRLESIEQLESQWEFPEPHRPPSWIAKPSRANAGTAHDVEENVRRFALQFKGWLHEQIERHQMPQLHVFAPTRLLGLFRKLLDNHVAERLVYHDADLATMTHEQLRKHGSITGLLQPASARR